jgi:glycosyltransferase involved in cell wall biosynthesis
MRILFIVKYPNGEAPSQRFRFEHYFKHLQSCGITYKIASFLDFNTWKILFKPDYKWKKTRGVLKGLCKRLIQLFFIGKYDMIFIHREATPIGPPWFEWCVAHVFRKKIVFDFDDAIWIPAVSKNNSDIKWLRNFQKIKKICKWATTIVVGNSFLADYALQYNNNVKIIPTVIDTERRNKTKDQHKGPLTIGWTGTFSTLKYLDIVLPVLQKLQEQYDFTFTVIADKDPQLTLNNYRFIKWNRETEIDDLLNFHIGLMPLYNDDISKGKCGFKAIQYMSLGIPAVISPVGVNTEIVEDGMTGFLCTTENEWSKRLEELLLNPALRTKLGLAAKQKIKEKYSVQATTEMFLDLFKNKT